MSESLTLKHRLCYTTVSIIVDEGMERCLSSENSWTRAFKRRRTTWMSNVALRSYTEYRLLDLSDDVLSVIMKRLLPRTKVLRGRSFASYRDVVNLAFTCRRLANIFRLVREVPSEVDGLFDQVLLGPSTDGLLRYPSPAEAPFFRNLIGDCGVELRKLCLPCLSSVEISPLVNLVVSICVQLRALRLTDAGALSEEAVEQLTSSSISTLRVFRPSVQTLRKLAKSGDQCHTFWICGVSEHFFTEQTRKFIQESPTLLCNRDKPGGLKFRLKTGEGNVLRAVCPLLIQRHPFVEYIYKDEDKSVIEPRLTIRCPRISRWALSKNENSSVVDIPAAFKGIPVRLTLQSLNQIEEYLRAEKSVKEQVKKNFENLVFIDIGFEFGSEASGLKVCECLLDILNSENNRLYLLNISREFVALGHHPVVVDLLKRTKQLRKIHLGDFSTEQRSGQAMDGLRDDLFLDRLPMFVDRLQEHCKSLQTLNMSTCFQVFPFEKRQALRPKIENALHRLSEYESGAEAVNVDGLRRALWRWLDRVNLKQ
ncbi:hypothetical protein BWQ96_01713 [Gracilariopsis chorda]|uniref:F-box domain-containing protein n=1 Tax=Gracilariopsis chorda TaxID=448386 RepID=A0A2V3J2D6_9FLOR|nr:hypothetical protein BWQ96_01713 [Gracilariopsis chorda]|eukprot:PXF48544.1 hypothetical protein BWQ96_01713 [Gracilariopsis chorda]